MANTSSQRSELLESCTCVVLASGRWIYVAWRRSWLGESLCNLACQDIRL